MGSQWHVRWKGQEKGPFSFQQLAKFVRAGKLTEDDFVRRLNTTTWVRVRDVVGLLHVADQEETEETEQADSERPEVSTTKSTAEPEVAAAQTDRRPKILKRVGRRGVVVGSLVIVAILVVGAIIWRRQSRPLFPHRTETIASGRQASREKVLAAANAARSKTPSVPGLESGVPQLVPGLEKTHPTSSLSLTEDLRSVVFAKYVWATKSSDLLIASRDSVSEPFADAVPITTCNSDGFEGKPNISPDGLEMLFTRAADRSLWFHTRRSSTASDFGEPEPWLPSALWDITGDITCTRFLDALHLLVSVDNGKGKPPSFYLVKRKNTEQDFDSPQEVSMDGCGAWACVRPDRLLAYFGTVEGLFVQGRDNLEERFCPGHCILEPDVCGPVQGAIWVTPGDDVAFYRSSGPPGQSDDKTRIWMIRF